MADVIVRNDPSVAGLRTAFSKLGNSLFPDAATRGSRRLNRARELKTYSDIRVNEQKIAKAIRERDAAMALAEGVRRGIVSPEAARNIYANAALGGASYMNAVPGFFAGYVGTQPGQTAYQGDALTDLQTTSGVQSFTGTREGQEEAQAAQTARTNATIAGAAARQEAANQAAMDRTLQRPVSVGESSTVYLTPERAEAIGRGPGQTVIQGAGLGVDGEGPARLGAQGPFAGTGADQQNRNIVATLGSRLRRGEPLSPDEQATYNASWQALYGPKTTIVTLADGSKAPATVQLTPPVGTIPPAQVPTAGAPAPAGTAPPVQQAATPGAVAQPAPVPQPSVPAAPPPAGTAVVPPTQPQPVVAQPQPAAVPPAPTPPAVQPGQVPGVPGVTVGPALTPPRPGTNRPTEIQLRGQFFAQRMAQGASQLFNLLGYDPQTGTLNPEGYRPSITSQALQEVAQGAFGGLGRIAAPYGMSDADQAYYTSAQQFINPILRFDSGAAIPEGEYPRYYAQFLPVAGEGDASILLKLNFIRISIEAMQRLAGETGADVASMTNEDLLARPDLARRYQEIKSELEVENNIRLPRYNPGTGQMTLPVQMPTNTPAPIPATPAITRSPTIDAADSIVGFGAE